MPCQSCMEIWLRVLGEALLEDGRPVRIFRWTGEELAGSPLADGPQWRMPADQVHLFEGELLIGERPTRAGFTGEHLRTLLVSLLLAGIKWLGHVLFLDQGHAPRLLEWDEARRRWPRLNLELGAMDEYSTLVQQLRDMEAEELAAREAGLL